MLRFCFAGSRLAMTMLVLAPPRTATSSFNLRRLTPVLPIAIGRPSPPLPKEAVNARRLKTAAAEIPIASDAPPRHTSRGFLHWRFAYAGPGAGRATVMGAGIRKPPREETAGREAIYCVNCYGDFGLAVCCQVALNTYLESD